jgi:hypothetical protein
MALAEGKYSAARLLCRDTGIQKFQRDVRELLHEKQSGNGFVKTTINRSAWRALGCTMHPRLRLIPVIASLSVSHPTTRALNFQHGTRSAAGFYIADVAHLDGVLFRKC